MSSQYLQIMVSIDDKKQAEQIIKALLRARLIACGQCLPKMNSYYRWQGKICCDTEYLMFLKTQKQHAKACEELIKKHHPYDVPEIIAVDIVTGNEDYLTWIKDET